MSRPPLNLASRPFRNEALPALLFGIASVAVLGLTIAHALLLRRELSESATDRHKEVAALEAETASLRKALAVRPAPPDRAVLAQWTLLRELVDRRAFSWSELLARLEDVLPAGVRLIGIAPSLKEGKVHLEVTAAVRSSEDGLGFVHALESRPEFAEVYPLGVSEREDGAEFRYTMRYEAPPPGAPRAAAAKAGDQDPAADEELSPDEEPPPDDEAPPDDEPPPGAAGTEAGAPS